MKKAKWILKVFLIFKILIYLLLKQNLNNIAAEIPGKNVKIPDNQLRQTPPHIEVNARGEELHLSEFLKTFKYNNEMKLQLIKDLKSINLKSWFHRSGHEVLLFFFINICMIFFF